MSASRFLLLGSSLLRAHKPFFPPSLILSPNAFPFTSRGLRFHRYSSSAAVDAITADSTDSPNGPLPPHPWPEWVAFVDELRTKGYLTEAHITKYSSTEAAILYKDMDLLKNACLSFARDRYDLFKLLSKRDMETIVERGCPNLLRKPVNSAKRLRAHLGLDEGDVCSTCNLRGSCDRAYVMLKEPEAAARTVDIVRILLFYALDPLVISGGDKPVARELIDASAKKLLSELIKWINSGPERSRVTVKSPFQTEKDVNFRSNVGKPSENVEMKRGDWICPKCNFMNFSKNQNCQKCNEDGPKGAASGETIMRKGDWTCPECNFMNFSRNKRCLKCKCNAPKRVSTADVEMKKGDWICPECEFMNFASNKSCYRCREPRPKRQLNPGEWECPSCDFVNYGRNTVCLKCQHDRPKEGRGLADTESDEQIWRKPY